MRKFIFAAFLACAIMQAEAQELTVNTKFGKPTTEELELTEYQPEPDAAALVLSDSRTVYFHESQDDFHKFIEQKVRIKILKQEGTDYANVELRYYDSNSRRDFVSKVQATAYNMENGKVVATKMKNDLVFRERINDKVMRLKFTIPAVKVGTVIEYGFKIETPDIFSISDWYAQRSIPVFNTTYDLTIPDMIRYNVELVGPSAVKMKREQVNINIGSSIVSTIVNGQNYVFTGQSLESIKDDDYVWCIDDYRTKVTSELQSINLSNYTRSYTSTWEKVTETMMNDEDFGKRIGKGTPFDEDIKALHLENVTDTLQKVTALYNLLMDRVTWNGDYTLAAGKSSNAVVKDGKGSSSDLNFLLINMLIEAGIDAWPVVLSTREDGRLPLTYPSIDRLSTFVVGFSEAPGKVSFIDATSKSGYINILSPNLMPDRALMMPRTGECQWVDLSERCKGREVIQIKAQLSADGKVTGTRERYMINESSYHFKNVWNNGDSTEIVEKISNGLAATITDYAVENSKEFSANVKETITFEKEAQNAGNVIYVNPFVITPWDENPFKQEKRSLPIERPYTTNDEYNVVLTIPEGSQVEELPKPLSLKTADGSISCVISFQQNENTLITTYRYKVNRMTFSSDEYEGLKEVYEHIVAKCNEMVAIKKP